MLKTPRKERDLTPRENEVLKLVAEGWTPQEIASQLQISPKTVEVFRQNLLRKGGAKNSVQLVLTARAAGGSTGTACPFRSEGGRDRPGRG